MSGRWMIPMLDFVFLSLGGLLALITQMDQVSSLPLELSGGDAEASEARAENTLDVVSVTADAIAVNGTPSELDRLVGMLRRDVVLVRCDRRATVERLTPVLAALHADGSREVRLQFEALTPEGVGR
ncbi:MAG: hypothetical protein AAFR38_10605 [Planctomycetota bacterium]